MAPALQCSIGIMAHNEAANIASAIDTILSQPAVSPLIGEVIVVASGCTDQTVPIVADIERYDARVRLIVQDRREGKASAINLFLRAARSPILIMVSADVLVKEGTIEALLRHFEDPTVGMVGGHPVPVNNDDTLLGYAVHLLWRMHDVVARESPKLGEIVAFRNVVQSIPLDTPVDEISIQALITQLGYQLVYEPQAIVYNRGPSTAGDFLRQRRRIYAGHLRIRQQQGYTASTMSTGRVVRALLAIHPFTTPHTAWWTMCAVGLEATARGLGYYDYLRRRPHHVWQMVASTKPQIAATTMGQGLLSVLVFRIVNLYEHELELGSHAARALTQQVMHQVRQILRSDAVVTVERSGTIIALLAVEREEAERIAQHLVKAIEATPLHVVGRGPGAAVTLACGIIAFSGAGNPLAVSIPAAAERLHSVTDAWTREEGTLWASERL